MKNRLKRGGDKGAQRTDEQMLEEMVSIIVDL